MRTPFNHSHEPSATRGFSLLELLVVIAIIAIVAGVSVGGIGASLNAQKLSTAGGMVADELLSARQSAISMNRRVMMRFFMQNGTFSAFQSYVQQTNAALQTNAWEPLSKVVRLSEAVAVHPSTVFSSIPCNALVGTNGSPVVPQVLGTVAEIRQFAFLPDGSLDLPTTSDWCLTLVRSAPPSTSNSPLPSNFITIQLNHSGRIKVFRP